MIGDELVDGMYCSDCVELKGVDEDDDDDDDDDEEEEEEDDGEFKIDIDSDFSDGILGVVLLVIAWTWTGVVYDAAVLLVENGNFDISFFLSPVDIGEGS